MTLTEKVYSMLTSESHRDVRGPLTVSAAFPYTPENAFLTDFELNCRDWGLTFGLAYGIARGEDPFEPDDAVLNRALDAAADAWTRFGGRDILSADEFEKDRAARPVSNEDDPRNVTLTREQRDGLRWFVACHLEADGLGHRVRDEDPAAVQELVDSLPPCIRVLDQIGWEESGSKDAYVLIVDRGLVDLLAFIRPSMEGAIRDDLAGLNGESALEGDRAALAAADLIEGVVVA